MHDYELASKVDRSETGVLAVVCSDHRFQRGLREFLDSPLSLNGNYDVLVVPGGPGCLADLAHLPKFAWASRKWFRFLVVAHAVKRVILIAHQDCGWYKWLAEYEVQGGPEPRVCQEHDLRRVRAFLASSFPQLSVELYYTGWDPGDRLWVEPVAA